MGQRRRDTVVWVLAPRGISRAEESPERRQDALTARMSRAVTSSGRLGRSTDGGRAHKDWETAGRLDGRIQMRDGRCKGPDRRQRHVWRIPVPIGRKHEAMPKHRDDPGRLLNALVGRRAEVMALLASAPPEQLAWRPRDGAWSALEVIEHLVLSEAELLATGRRASQAGRGVLRTLQARILGWIVRFRIPVPVPSGAMNPSGRRSLQELACDWDANHRGLADLVIEAENQPADFLVFSHPVAPMLTLPELLLVGTWHVDYHLPQIRRRLGGR